MMTKLLQTIFNRWKDIEKIKKRTKTVIEKCQLGKTNPQHKAAITEEEYKTAMQKLIMD